MRKDDPENKDVGMIEQSPCKVRLKSFCYSVIFCRHIKASVVVFVKGDRRLWDELIKPTNVEKFATNS